MDDRAITPPLPARALLALALAGYVVVPDPAGYWRIRRRRAAHL